MCPSEADLICYSDGTLDSQTRESVAYHVDGCPACLAIGEATSILLQVASGSAAAHEVGVIHRDLKADNVMLVRDGNGKARAVITDFGPARRADVAGAHEHAALSRTYSAPEQLLGHPSTAGSDVYAFGMMACDVLADPGGRDAMSRAELRERLNGKRRGEQLPSAIRAWILRAADPDPERRFAAPGTSVLQDGPHGTQLAVKIGTATAIQIHLGP